MNRRTLQLVLGALALLPGVASATTREIADFRPTRLIFGQSVLNQLSHDTYREPFDELQTRPYNLLFANIGRHANLSPWQGQEGGYTRYVNALIGNNGTANVDNDADAAQGSLVRRESEGMAWGLSTAFLIGAEGSDSSNATLTTTNTDDVSGVEVRGGAAFQISERRVLGAGIRLTQATSEITEHNLNQGTGGSFEQDKFEQVGLSFDVGLRQFQTSRSSWEAQVIAGFGTAEQDELTESLDSSGNITSRFVARNYDITEMNLGIIGGYNRLRSESLGETQFRAGLERSQRELDNNDLSFTENGGGITPSLTLLGQDAVTTTQLFVSAATVFPAGETEMFAGARLGYGMVSGSTQADAAGTLVSEEVDDTLAQLGLTVGLRQPLFSDRLRFIVSGRADLVNQERSTIFTTNTVSDDSTLSTAQYAIGLEGVLANVTFDLAWLAGEEAPVVSPVIGLPAGSRRTVDLDRLVFSAAVSW